MKMDKHPGGPMELLPRGKAYGTQISTAGYAVT
jgi:hypothetical protein